jgi:hypothetical protein
LEPAQGSGEAFGRRAGVDQQHVRPEGQASGEPADNQDPGGIISAQLLADSQDGQPAGRISLPQGRPCCAELPLPGAPRYRHLFHNKR